jgi:hypothetical protein
MRIKQVGIFSLFLNNLPFILKKINIFNYSRTDQILLGYKIN